MKVLTNQRHNLWFGHFIGSLLRDNVGTVRVFLELFFQFALGLSRAEDQD